MKPKTVGRADTAVDSARQLAQQAKLATGLAVGAHIMTLDGEIPVDVLSAGDRVITRDSGIATVRHVTRVTRAVQAIGLSAGSIGHTRPDHDVVLSADQTLFIRDWRAMALFGQSQVLVTAGNLVDGEFIRDLGTSVLTLTQIFCDQPHILYADGLEMGTADATPTLIRNARVA